MNEAIEVRELVDIRTVKVNKNLPKNERILDYVKQIKNPYKYKCGKFTVTAVFQNNGISIEDCLYNTTK